MKQKRVLVVDDDPFILRLAKIKLEYAGYSVDTSESGVVAWAKLRQNRYDVLITDLIMNGMNGLELVRNLRQDVRFADLPIILMHYMRQDRSINEQVKQLSEAVGGNNRISNKPDLPQLLTYTEELAGAPSSFHKNRAVLHRFYRRLRRYL